MRCPARVLIMILLQVHVIMMITKLVEGNKVKAHQYWPSDGSDNSDIDNPTDHIIDLGDDCKVQFKSSSFQGTYYLRYISTLLVMKRVLCQHHHCHSFESIFHAFVFQYSTFSLW